MRTKLVAIAVVVALLLPFLGIQQAKADATVPFVKVSVIDGYVGDYEEYHLSFRLGRDVSTGQTLTITFDDSVYWAGLRDLAPGDITLDGVAAGASARWSDSRHVLTVTASSALSAGTEHTMVILRSAMVQNPWEAVHLRLTLRDDTAGTIVASNYYGITTTTQLTPLSLTVDSSNFTTVTVHLRFQTGRSGALTGASTSSGPGQAASSSSDTITLRLSPGLSLLWDQAGGPVARWSKPYLLKDRTLKLVSVVDRLNGDSVDYRKQVTYAFDASVDGGTDVDIWMTFARVDAAASLTTADYVDTWTTKEPTIVRVNMSGVPDVAPETPPAPAAADTTAPAVTWTSSASALLPRLVTLHIVVTEDNLDEAWFSGGTDSLIHTRLSPGDNEVMVINRSGIHGTVTAADKSGNTTTVPIDLPALAGG
jgi:hypothetical protein